MGDLSRDIRGVLISLYQTKVEQSSLLGIVLRLSYLGSSLRQVSHHLTQLERVSGHNAHGHVALFLQERITLGQAEARVRLVMLAHGLVEQLNSLKPLGFCPHDAMATRQAHADAGINGAKPDSVDLGHFCQARRDSEYPRVIPPGS